MNSRFLVLLVLLGPGCTFGLRASGGCPDGETCSDLTPDGLVFRGDYVQSGSDPFVPMASRGTRHLGVSAIGVALPPYDAVVRDPTVATATRTTDRGELVLTGLAPGRTLLRLVAEGTNELFDAVPLRVETIAEVRVHPPTLVDLAAGTSDWAFYGGVAQQVSVELLATDGTNLVDEGLTLTGLPLEETAWNAFQMGSDVGDGTHPMTVHAGDTDFAAQIVLTTALDRIALLSVTGGTALVVGESAYFCVVGVDGTRSVWGVPAEITGDGTRVTVMPSGTSCVQVAAVAAGAGRIDATLGSLTASVTVDVAAAMEGMASMPLVTASTSVSRSVLGLRAAN